MVKLFILHSAFRIPHLDDPFSPEISLYEQKHQTQPKTMKTKLIQTTGPRDYRTTGLNIAMKTPPLLTLLTLPALLTLFTLLGPVPASAQTWQTIDDFQYAPGLWTDAIGVTCDPSGNVWVAGWGAEPGTPAYHGLVQKSADGGNTWSLSDDFSTGGTGGTFVYGMTPDFLGNLYYVGYQAHGGPLWFTRQSTDGGLTWNTVDTLGYSDHAHSVATDSYGNVYVAGWGGNGNGTNSWTVRKGANFGASWQTVDSLGTNNSSSAYGVFCYPPTQRIFVTGIAQVSTTNPQNGKVTTQAYWTTRRSTDGGVTWANVDASVSGTGYGVGADAFGNIYAVGSSGIRKGVNGGASWSTVDNFYYCVTTTSSKPPYTTSTQCYGGGAANAFAMDPNGNLFAVGYASTPSGAVWLVKESPGGTGAWTTVDAFQYVPGKGSFAKAVVSDAAGHVYVAGLAEDASGVNHWIVRKH